jgi:ATP-dependent 26S proteasome regulatory subunit
MTRHLSDIHESIRGELAVSHIVRKPNLQDRLEWLNNFETNIKNRVVKDGALTIGENTNVTGIDLACDFSIQEFALQSAGMNRRQIKDVILNSWRNQVPVDFPLVQERKKRALEDEYGGMIDIKEPSFGFELIGGHDHFKDFCQWKIIKPLRSGNKKLCARGALMTGPPGTGKTMAAWALAKEAGVNFIIVDFGKVFGGLVGETESNTRKLIEAIEAAAPCVVFGDELDSVFSSGRQSAGDSGTSARVFNSLMTWLSDPGRVGKVVFLAATNRPELLDAALIRAGRMDVKIPMLPPAKGDAKGRWAILKSQTHKHKIVLADDLIASKNNPQAGLGRLLYDPKRIWTGAEMEQLLQAAFDETIRAERKADEKDDLRVFLADWDAAFDNIIPNTDEVERMTNLALLYVDNLRYVPAEWREAARDKKNLREVCGLDK